MFSNFPPQTVDNINPGYTVNYDQFGYNQQYVQQPNEHFTHIRDPIRQRKPRRSKYDVSHMVQAGGHHTFENTKQRRTTADNYLTSPNPSLDLRGVKTRTIFSDEQFTILEAAFQKHGCPEQDQRALIAQLCGLSEEIVRVWYQNRRARQRREREDDLAMTLPILAKQKAERNMSMISPAINPAINDKINEIFGQLPSTHQGSQYPNSPNSNTDPKRKKRKKIDSVAAGVPKKRKGRISEVDLIKSIMRGEDVLVEDNIVADAQSAPNSPHQINDYARDLHSTPQNNFQEYVAMPTTPKSEENSFYSDNHLNHVESTAQPDITNLYHTFSNEPIVGNVESTPQSEVTNSYQPNHLPPPPQQFGMWANPPNGFGTMSHGGMSAEQMNQMLMYQQNLFMNYQRFMMSGQMMPLQMGQPGSAKTADGSMLNQFQPQQHMFPVPQMPMFAYPPQYQNQPEQRHPTYSSNDHEDVSESPVPSPLLFEDLELHPSGEATTENVENDAMSLESNSNSPTHEMHPTSEEVITCSVNYNNFCESAEENTESIPIQDGDCPPCTSIPSDVTEESYTNQDQNEINENVTEQSVSSSDDQINNKESDYDQIPAEHHDAKSPTINTEEDEDTPEESN